MSHSYPPKPLLAKSYKGSARGAAPPEYTLLLRHTQDVVEAGQELLDAVGQIALACAGISLESIEDFKLTLRANCWVQDLGKANTHFDAMVTDDPNIKQLLRHETISGLLMTAEPLRGWFAKLPLRESLRYAALWGAMGHHRKFYKGTVPSDFSRSALVYVTHPDFKEMLKRMSKELNLDEPPEFERDLIISANKADACDFVALKTLRKLFSEFKSCKTMYDEDVERRILALVKGFGIAADIAASAVAKRDQDEDDYSLQDFVIKDLASIGLTEKDLESLQCKWAWKRSDKDPNTHDTSVMPPDIQPNDFQKSVALSNKYLTLVQAGCGSGKSLAAYLWAEAWCKRFAAESRTNFRLFFLLPTTGTATEQFKDYALESGIEDVRLTHSRSLLDLNQIAETADQEDADDKSANDTAAAARANLKAKQDKIEALELWSTPLVVGTADTVLGLMVNSLKSVCSLPAIMSSAIVFDEIHAFDEQMFGHLLVFLKNFPRLPVLLMTASLPAVRLKAIRDVRDLEVVPGPDDFELMERYLINDTASNDEVWQAVEACVASNGKVLWVRNQVERANETYRDCLKRYFAKYGAYIDVYHSRFRYIDRAYRHARVIKNFKPKSKKGAILVATQVAEMSLDLSADLLITDIAPIPALIQRMGRLNRRSPPKGATWTLEAKWAYIRPLPNEPNAELPYEKEDYERAKKWLQRLTQPQRALNQRDLAEAFVGCSSAELETEEAFNLKAVEQAACFFSGLWETKPGQTRGAGYTINVVLQKDEARCTERNKRGEPTRKWLREYEVSIPYKDRVRSWERAGHTPIAPDDEISYCYDKEKNGTGASWKK